MCDLQCHGEDRERRVVTRRGDEHAAVGRVGVVDVVETSLGLVTVNRGSLPTSSVPMMCTEVEGPEIFVSHGAVNTAVAPAFETICFMVGR